MLRINKDRFLNNLTELAQIGQLPDAGGGGLDRRPFSAAERAARNYFSRQAEAAGLIITTDGAANLSAQLPCAKPTAQTMLLGSHLDTVPNGGPYDGALGVVAALEVLRTVQESNCSLPVHLEAIAFTDEEGRFGDFFGSQALAGLHSAESVEAFLARAAEFPDDLTAMGKIVPGGLNPQSIHTARRAPNTIAGFIELHIEQGPQLEQAAAPVGVVDAIFGRCSMRAHFYGRSDHAGTTPLPLRADALVAAAQFIAGSPQLVSQYYPGAVITCGNVTVKPGVFNVVPHSVSVQVEFRAAAESTLRQIKQTLRQLAGNCTLSTNLSYAIKPVDQHRPAAMAGSVQAAIQQAGQLLGYKTMALSSGAGHDAQSLAALTPTGIIFVPSKDGRSHCPEEDTAPADLIAGANVLLHTALILAGVNHP